MKQECLPALSRIAPHASFAAEKTIALPAQARRLQSEEILRLEKKSKVQKINVLSGAIWLTGTPANGDILLSAGDTFYFENQWPYLIQALESSQVVIA